MSEGDPRVDVAHLYGGPDLARLFAAARDRLERRDGDVGGTIRLTRLSDAERRAAAWLIGSPTSAGETVVIALTELDRALRDQRLELGLVDVVEALGGQLRHRRGERARVRAARLAPLEEARAHPALTRHAVLAEWLDWLRRRGLLSSLDPADARVTVGEALAVLERLPGDALLSELAGQVTGRTHALDRGTLLATLCDRGVALIAGLDPVQTAADRRGAWGALGIVLDDVSPTVLVLGFRARGETPLERVFVAAADAGEPLVVTLRMLRAIERIELDTSVVHICENPAVVVRAAERLGRRAAPLVCLGGVPSTAGLRLLAVLRAGGAELRYHGDFDWDGLRIANGLVDRGVRSWRYRATDYIAAVSRTLVREPLGPGRVGSHLDERLAVAMSVADARIYEEQVLDELVADLGPSTRDAPTITPAPSVARDAWIGASRTRNWMLDDPLLDWLGAHGARAGFVRDDELPTYDARTDFRGFVTEQGRRFEAGVMRLLSERGEVRTIAKAREDARSEACATATIDALRAGTPIIAQGVLHDTELGVFGVPDLLVRSDVLARLFPDTGIEEGHGAPLLGLAHHYRVVDIKFHTFDLVRDGHASSAYQSLPFLAQTWLYNHALGAIQGFQAPSAYLLGRGWRQGEERVDSCLDRLARVDAGRWIERRGASLEDLSRGAVNWLRRLVRDGWMWTVLPEPSVPELRPNLRVTDDAPWHAAERAIADELADLTTLPRVGPTARSAAGAIGVRRWDDLRVTAERLGIRSPLYAGQFEAILAANRVAAPTVVPERFTGDREWASPPPIEFFVDFETVSDLDDDFTQLPTAGGQELIFQIGCGHLDGSGAWHFSQWTTDRLTTADEGRIIADWLGHMTEVARSVGLTLPATRINHWSPAETSTLESAWNAARLRHLHEGWPDPDALPWFDLLNRLARAVPIGVTGAFGYGLKAIAKAMKAGGLIDTTWANGPADGLGAMVGAWWCDAEAERTGTPMWAQPLMREIGRYNEVDCRVMAETLAWFRAHR